MSSFELRGTRAPGRGGRDRPDFSSRRSSGGGGSSGGDGGGCRKTAALILVAALSVLGTAAWGVAALVQAVTS